MPIKYTVDDFNTLITIDNLIEKCKESSNWGPDTDDSEGYTLLCFAALNGVKPDKLVYLINNYDCNASKVCGKGKTPLQCAILSGCLESVDALLGNPVFVYNEIGEPIDSDDRELDQPKKDAIGNPIALRDNNDNIIYERDNISNMPIPLNVNEDGETIVRQKCRLIKDGLLVNVPPLSANYKIKYKYEDDAKIEHTPMRDTAGKPLKQCDSNGNEIHKKDITGKDIGNRFEYVWDYEYQPKYEIAYKKKTVYLTNKSADVIDHDLCEAAKLSTSDILISLYSKYKSDGSTTDIEIIKDKYESTLLYLACMISCYASVDYILEKVEETKRISYIFELCGTDDNKLSAYDLACNNGDIALANKLLSHCNIYKYYSDAPDNFVLLDASDLCSKYDQTVKFEWSGDYKDDLLNSDTLTPTFKIPEDATVNTIYQFKLTFSKRSDNTSLDTYTLVVRVI